MKKKKIYQPGSILPWCSQSAQRTEKVVPTRAETTPGLLKGTQRLILTPRPPRCITYHSRALRNKFKRDPAPLGIYQLERTKCSDNLPI